MLRNLSNIFGTEENFFRRVEKHQKIRTCHDQIACLDSRRTKIRLEIERQKDREK